MSIWPNTKSLKHFFNYKRNLTKNLTLNHPGLKCPFNLIQTFDHNIRVEVRCHNAFPNMAPPRSNEHGNGNGGQITFNALPFYRSKKLFNYWIPFEICPNGKSIMNIIDWQDKKTEVNDCDYDRKNKIQRPCYWTILMWEIVVLDYFEVGDSTAGLFCCGRL